MHRMAPSCRLSSYIKGILAGIPRCIMEVPGPIRKKGLHIQPKGSYLRAFCKGSWEHLPERYLDILSYAREQGLRLSGFAYEKGINEMVIDTLDEYITEIEIPVQLP